MILIINSHFLTIIKSILYTVTAYCNNIYHFQNKHKSTAYKQPQPKSAPKERIEPIFVVSELRGVTMDNRISLK